VREALQKERVQGKPRAIVADTIKGKGISFMENDNTWHHNRLTLTQYNQAMEELNA
jgi:transketolase